VDVPKKVQQKDWGWGFLGQQHHPRRLVGVGGGLCTAISRRRRAVRECPRLSSPAARPLRALVQSRRISPHPAPQPTLPLPPFECLLTHHEKASIMACRLPPSEEFRGAGPAGRQGTDGPGRLAIGWLSRVLLLCAAGRPQSHLPSRRRRAWEEETRWPLPRLRSTRNVGPRSGFRSPEGPWTADATRDARASPRHWGWGGRRPF
jgi:hypothetical protein